MDWFTFGVHLGVPHSELMKIRADYPDVDHRKVQTLSVYLKTNIERWYDIVRALIGIREIRLAEHIATKYGELMSTHFCKIIHINFVILKEFPYNNFTSERISIAILLLYLRLVVCI